MSLGKEERIAKFLDQHPQIIEILRSVGCKFSKMDRELIYKAIANRTSLEQLAQIENIDLDDLLSYLNTSMGETDGHLSSDAAQSQKTTPQPMPEFIKNLKEDRIIDIDVRDDIFSGQDPINKIKSVIAHLTDENAVRLKNFFEPFPLYNVMAKKGITHWTERVGDYYLVYFYKDENYHQQ